jgi:hypothetical protein
MASTAAGKLGVGSWDLAGTNDGHAIRSVGKKALVIFRRIPFSLSHETQILWLKESLF